MSLVDLILLCYTFLNSQMSNPIDKINAAIRWSFYIIFFFVPLIMWPDTFELFEFNKMWFVFGFSILIFFLWGSKMIIEKKFEIRRTPFDIPIVLFLVSQIISTFISMEPHTSLWGYYSRFNGGLFSTIAYILLYYAFATNLIPKNENENSHEHKHNQNPASYKLLATSLFSGIVVTLWGLPGHYGYDATCFVFRGTLDTSCWTADFNPTIRIFSTLGQPNWLGTFLAALLPISMGFGLYKLKESSKKLAWPIFWLVTTFLFFIAIIFTDSQSSFLAAGIAIVMFFAAYVYYLLKNTEGKLSEKLNNKTVKYAGAIAAIIILTTFFFGTPIASINKFATLKSWSGFLSSHTTAPAKTQNTPTPQGSFSTNPTIEIGGSTSSKIRLIVWEGAMKIFMSHPLFGSGVETYAFAYYQVKPLAHNMTSEWDFLYNKAHNEYLNYLATTGAFGLGTYLLIIIFFYYFAFKNVIKTGGRGKYFFITTGIVSGFTAMLISDFFGFSVVPINLMIFTFPIFLVELDEHKLEKSYSIPKGAAYSDKISPLKLTAIVFLGLVCIYYEFSILNYWSADRKYALGNNYDKVSQYTQAYEPLTEAVSMVPSEDLYKDELSINMATLSLLLSQNNRATEASQFGQRAKALSDSVIAAHPNNIVYYKTRIRVLYALSAIDPSLLDQAIAAANFAKTLAPTDAKLEYNIALFYQQKGDDQKTIEALNETIRLKPNYVDPRYAKAVLYAKLAKQDPKNAAQDKAIAKSELTYILQNIESTHKPSIDLLKTL